MLTNPLFRATKLNRSIQCKYIPEDTSFRNGYKIISKQSMVFIRERDFTSRPGKKEYIK